MKILPILNSPGYYISDEGIVYNKEMVKLKPFLKKDGYERILLFSKKHNRRVNRSIHLLVAEAFLKNGSYVTSNGLQVNHIDGNKRNNNLSNLEVVTRTENVNKAHNMGLYKFDLKVRVANIVTKKVFYLRSIRKAAEYFKLPLNVMKPRIEASKEYPLFDKYVLSVNKALYCNSITKLKGRKLLYAYDNVYNVLKELRSYSQISILFGIPSSFISKKLITNPNKVIYKAGFSFSYDKQKLTNLCIDKQQAKLDRVTFYRNLIANTPIRFLVESKR